MNRARLKVVCALACLGLASGDLAQDSATKPTTKPDPGCDSAELFGLAQRRGRPATARPAA